MNKTSADTHTSSHVLIHRFAVATVIHIQNKTHASGGSRDDLKGDVIGGVEGGFFSKKKGKGFQPFCSYEEGVL